MIIPVETSDFGPILVAQRPRAAAPEAPRRGRHQSRAARRLAAAIIIAAVAAALLARMASAAVRPLVVAFQAGQEVKRLRVQVASQRERHERLLQEIAYLKTPAGIEEEARRQGWVRDGETAIQVIRPQSEAPDAAPRVRRHPKSK